jgi:dephospho-CoA kinase
MGLDVSAAPRVLLGGGIGAGKSTIAAVFAENGFFSIDADRIAAEMMSPGSDTTVAVAQWWPSVVSCGAVDRRALAEIVFADEAELRHLETITHPEIVAEIVRRVSGESGAVIVEIPLLHLELPGVWCRIAVIADEDVRIARAVARGGTAADVCRRVSTQPSDDEWAEWGDVVIANSGSWADTLKAAEAAIAACT